MALLHQVSRRPLLCLLAAAFALFPHFRAETADRDRAAGVDAQAPTRSEAPGLPLQMERTVRFTTDEGTWISLDVSPDGRLIVFELLGDLYTLPIEGGRAARITSGPAYDAQPRYSPDGRRLVFVSDRQGSENLWLADADGSNLRQLTKGANARYQSPEWLDDQSIVASKGRGTGYGTTYDIRQYDLMMYFVAGGSGLKLAPSAVPPAPVVDNFIGAAVGADPRYLYVAARRGPFPDLRTLPQWQVATYDRETGRIHVRSREAGSAVRPVVSPDGRYLVFGTRFDAAEALKLREIESGDETWLAPSVQRDEQESIFSRDLLPGSSFTPDSQAFITSYGGRIWRLEVPSGKATIIPFTAEVEMDLAPPLKFNYRIDETKLTVTQIRNAAPSPDGRRLAFSALSRLWVMDLPAGTPHRLTDMDAGEHCPAWSPDGQYIAYVTWTESGGDVYRVRADRTAAPERLTRQRAYYDRLAFSPDGLRLVMVKGARQARIDERPDVLDLVWLPASGGATSSIAPITAPGRPHFTRDPSRVYVFDRDDGLVSMRFDGTDRRSVLRFGATDEPVATAVISPDGERALALLRNQLFLVTVPKAGDGPVVPLNNPAGWPVPVVRVTRIGADFPGWSGDGQSLYWSLGRFFFSQDVAAVEHGTAAARGNDSGRPAEGQSAIGDPDRIEVRLVVEKDRPHGSVLLRGGRVITMKGLEVLERADVLVTDSRIVSVGPRGKTSIPPGTPVVDVSGKTILPGWVDVHAHMSPTPGVHRTEVWQYLANLAYGVTTTRDPQTGTTDVLAYQDLVETGEMIGPRVFSTGPGLFAEENVTSLDEARNLIRRYAEYYATNYVKQYGIGERRVRQWLVMAAREMNVTPVTEPYYDVKKNVTEMVDGYPDAAHGFPIFPIGKDLLSVMKASGQAHTPTLITTFGGPKAYEWFYTRRNLHDDPKLRRFWPHQELDSLTLRRGAWYHDSQFIWKEHARELVKMVKLGIPIVMGGHGNMQGLQVHWELEMMASGGMEPHEVLRSGTIVAALTLGLAEDLGSIEPGKLADLQVLDRNPLVDIRNTTAIRYVMKNGRLYEAETLKEVWPRQRELAKPWWWDRDPTATAAGAVR